MFVTVNSIRRRISGMDMEIKKEREGKRIQSGFHREKFITKRQKRKNYIYCPISSRARGSQQPPAARDVISSITFCTTAF
jgi:hypothetical protein